jgi:hypothetical protein
MKSMKRLPRTRVLIAFGMAIGGILWVAERAEAHGGDPSVIHGCVQKSSGLVRIVAANESCRDTETALHFGGQAPQGLTATLTADKSMVAQFCTPGGPTAPKSEYHDGPGVVIGPGTYLPVNGSEDVTHVGIEEYNAYNGNTNVWLQIMDVTTPNTAVAQRHVNSVGTPQHVTRAEYAFQTFVLSAPATLFLRTAAEVSGCGFASQTGAVYLVRVGG